MPVTAETAEWICTRCGSTNRRLVPAGTTETRDRCVTCHARHVVHVDERPVRWTSKLVER